jgi:hypothetical protein
MNTHTPQLQRRYQHTRGYTLLFAVITATLVLGVAVFILSVSKKQYALSVAARDSMYALYAADGALECTIASNLATSSGNGSPANVVVHCNQGNSIPVAFSGPISENSTLWPDASIYQAAGIVVNLPDSTCAVVSVSDGYYNLNTSPQHKLVIESRGYNFCDTDVGPKASSRTVERALRLTYR